MTAEELEEYAKSIEEKAHTVIDDSPADVQSVEDLQKALKKTGDR